MNHRCLFTLVLLLALGSCAASWMQFKSVPPDGGQPETVTGLLRVPDGGGRHPAVVLLPDCDGVGPHERRWGRELAEAGYVSYVIDHYFTRGGGERCAEPLDPAVLQGDAQGALEKLAGEDYVDADRMAVIGWGGGGDIALDLVTASALLPGTEGVRMVAAFYPTCKGAGYLRREALIILPDQYPAAVECQSYAESQASGGEAPVRLVPVPGAAPGFDCEVCPDGYRGQEGVYDPAASERVRQVLLDALDRLIGPESDP